MILPGGPRGRRGFTLIELMVVVAIVVMAMGTMAPALLEYFRNQKLKSVRSHFSSAFTVARLMAITEGTPVRVVFFKEGVRVYNVHNKAFRKDEDFNPEAAPGSIPGISFELRFAKVPNSDLPEYRTWEKTQPHLNEVPGPANPMAGQCDVKDLTGVEYQRDGSVVWLQGGDVPTNLFKDKRDADVIVSQGGNSEALFIDIRPTGTIRAEFGPSPEEQAEKP